MHWEARSKLYPGCLIDIEGSDQHNNPEEQFKQEGGKGTTAGKAQTLIASAKAGLGLLGAEATKTFCDMTKKAVSAFSFFLLPACPPTTAEVHAPLIWTVDESACLRAW
jgi:hypothetical protein